MIDDDYNESLEHTQRKRLIGSYMGLLLFGMVLILAIFAGSFIFGETVRNILAIIVVGVITWSGYKLVKVLNE